METATLAGGCFWCVEAVFQELRGVESVTSGYMGGAVNDPTYEEVCGGTTGHAEVAQLEFDPAVVSYRQILEIFFAVHDPTTLNRQGNDVGTQYRSAIFWHSDEQRRTAETVIAELKAGAASSDTIVTEVVAAAPFWPAENYHQHYLRNHPNQPYCAFVVQPKVAKFRKSFSHLRKDA